MACKFSCHEESCLNASLDLCGAIWGLLEIGIMIIQVNGCHTGALEGIMLNQVNGCHDGAPEGLTLDQVNVCHSGAFEGLSMSR